MPRLITRHTLGAAMETTLDTHLWPLVQELGFADPATEPSDPDPLRRITVWDQVPTLDALTAAVTPVGGITSPGLVDRPTTRARRIDATWRVVVGVWDRGADYDDTVRRVGLWAALVRAVVLEHPTLGGVAAQTLWAGEEYAEIPQRSAARTLGGCAVAFDVTARDVVNLSAPDDPVVTDPSTDVTVEERNEE